MLPEDWADNFRHVGMLSTVCDQREADRDVPTLLALKAERDISWVGLSIEPMIGHIWLRWHGLRQPNTIYPASIGLSAAGNRAPARGRCILIGRAVFATSARPPASPIISSNGGEWAVSLDRDRDDPDWRADYSNDYVDVGKSRWLNLDGLRGFHGERFHVMRRVGKKVAGRLLDGVEHNGFPTVARQLAAKERAS